MYLSKKALHRMAQMDIKATVLDHLVDISKIEIDRKKCVSARVEDYVQNVRNPFLMRVGEYVVKIGYLKCKETLDDRMKQI